jgi:3-oxoacyl-[acyl-carrier-protein] synthase III
MIVTSEIDNNVGTGRGISLGVRETAAAVILDRAPDTAGFHRFRFHYATEYLADESVTADTSEGKTYLKIHRAPELDRYYLGCILSAVATLQAQDGLDLRRLKLICAPQRSSAFLTALAEGLDLPHDKLLNVVGDGSDLFTSSLAHCFGYARSHGLVGPGDQLLVIAAGSGIQVGCALYDC